MACLLKLLRNAALLWGCCPTITALPGHRVQNGWCDASNGTTNSHCDCWIHDRSALLNLLRARLNRNQQRVLQRQQQSLSTTDALALEQGSSRVQLGVNMPAKAIPNDLGQPASWWGSSCMLHILSLRLRGFTVLFFLTHKGWSAGMIDSVDTHP
eukprot:scaffold174561_cov21-Tisochrysis_lutea.AAC.3